MSQPTQGPVIKERVWRFVEALLTHAEDSPDFEIRWEIDKSTGREIDKSTGNPIFVVNTKRRFLLSLTGLKTTELNEVIKSLENLKIWYDRRQKRGKGSEIGDFALKLWSRDAERNKEQFERVWEASRPEKSKALEANYQKSEQFDWQNICKTMLEEQKRMTTNRLLDSEMVFDLNQIHVPLALVERKKTDKRQGDDFPENSHSYKPEYEETQKFEYEEFLAVLKTATNKKIAIIGEPGAGKTTLLQRIAFWVLENTNDLAIWIPLGNLPTTAPNFKEYLLNNWLQNALNPVTPEIKADFDKQLTAGRVWLLLDGVDEMATSGNALSFINNWLPAWSQNLHFVLTCRLNVWEANPNYLSGFQTYRTLEFNQEQVKQFINNCFQNRGGNHGGIAPTLGIELQQALNQPGKERIKDIVRNPLRLMMLCSTWQGLDGKLPDTKAKLYKKFVEKVYKWKEDEIRIIPEKRKELNAKLKELALAAIDKEENRFSLRHKFIESVLGEEWDHDKSFPVALKVGWLNRVGVDAENEPVYAFFHPTFQEYFAALEIKNWGYFFNHVPDNLAQGIYRIFEPQWKEVILLWLGRENVGKEEKEEFIKALVEFEDGCKEWFFEYEGFYKYRAYFLAAIGIAEFSKCNSANEIIKKVVKWSFGENYINSQMQQTQMRRTFAPRQMAEKAKATLLEMHHPLTVKALIEVMHTSLDEYTRIEVAEIVGKIDPGNSLAIATLIEIMYNFEQGWCTKAVRSLGKTAKGNQEAVAALVNLLHTIDTSSDKFGIRTNAASSLFLIAPEHPEAIPFIEHSSFHDIYFPGALKAGLINPNEPEWIALLVDKIRANPISEKEKYERLDAIQLLGEIDTNAPEATDALINLILTNPDEDTCIVVSCLGRIGKSDPKAIALLIELSCKHQNLGIRWQAIQSLCHANTNHEEVIWVLFELIRSNPDKKIGIDAALSLGQILKKYPLMSAVTALKNSLPAQINNNTDFHLYNEFYEVLMHCAQTMTYPDFHKAWHSTHLQLPATGA